MRVYSHVREKEFPRVFEQGFATLTALVADCVDVFLFLLLPALHDFGAHLQQTVLCLALREAGNCFCGAVDVKLGECSCLLDAVAFDDKFAGLA